MADLIHITSSHQIQNLLLLQENNVIILKNSVVLYDNSFIGQKKLNRLDAMHLLPYSSSRINIKNLYYVMRKFKEVKMCIENYSIGSFYSATLFNDLVLLIAGLLPKNSFYLFDEGTAFYTNNRILRSSPVRLRVTYLIKSLIYTRSCCIPKSITYFTRFQTPHLSSNIKIKRLKYPQRKVLKGKVKPGFRLLIGSSVWKLGVCSKDSYFSLLSDFIDSNDNKLFFYIPHRKELSELELIRSKGLEILLLHDDLESWIENNSEIPEEVAALDFSTVLLNLKAYSKRPKLKAIDTSSLELKNEVVYREIALNNALLK